MFKKIVQRKLKFFAKLILSKYQPKIVGITGSVGKTSAREAVFTVLKEKYRVRESIKNYNNEFGLPLTILGCNSAGKSLLGWCVIFFKACFLLLFKNKKYPEILVLEMGVDREGDMDYLLSIVKPDVGVLTMIGSSHLEYFKYISEIVKEKRKLIDNIKKDGIAVINIDNDECEKVSNDTKAKVMKYGILKKGDVNASTINFKFKELKEKEIFAKMDFKLSVSDKRVSVSIPKTIGNPVVYASLAAVCVGIYFKMNLVEIVNALEKLETPKGRMKALSGIKNTLIIDDTYNASPESSLAVISVVKDIKKEARNKKIAVMGDMLELGAESEEKHKEIGRVLAGAGFNMIVACGERARDILSGALEAKMRNNQLFHFDNTESAGKFVQDKMKQGDIVLVKGSQGARMEKVVLEIMADPLLAKDLLVRQSDEWLNK